MQINLRVETHEDIRTKRLELMLEVEHWLTKITKLNARYNAKLGKIRRELLELEKKLS